MCASRSLDVSYLSETSSSLPVIRKLRGEESRQEIERMWMIHQNHYISHESCPYDGRVAKGKFDDISSQLACTVFLQ